MILYLRPEALTDYRKLSDSPIELWPFLKHISSSIVSLCDNKTAVHTEETPPGNAVQWKHSVAPKQYYTLAL